MQEILTADTLTIPLMGALQSHSPDEIIISRSTATILTTTP